LGEVLLSSVESYLHGSGWEELGQNIRNIFQGDFSFNCAIHGVIIDPHVILMVSLMAKHKRECQILCYGVAPPTAMYAQHSRKKFEIMIERGRNIWREREQEEKRARKRRV
jgi:hypothetical protein